MDAKIDKHPRRFHQAKRHGALLFAAAASPLIVAPAWADDAGPYAAAAFGGVMLDNTFEQVFTPWDLEIEDSYFVGGALSARVAQPLESLEIEIEGQLVRHFGGQTHWELNAPLIVVRWTNFFWDDYLDTSAAFGVGPSFASETPSLEVENEGESQSAMVYWMAEFAFDLPAENWELLTRLHHRSTSYGLFGDDGGANALALGLRRKF